MTCVVCFALAILCFGSVRPAAGSSRQDRIKAPMVKINPASHLLDEGPSDMNGPLVSTDVMAGNSVLKLCECEYASIHSHGGLNCIKEGWFISSFEAVGHWFRGGGHVPLSSSLCCRLCIPEELDPEVQARLPDNTSLASVVSLECHPSASKDSVSCDGLNGFMTGFQHAHIVPDRLQRSYYPEGPPICCTPVIILSNGDAWNVEHCDCMWTSTTGCDKTDDRLLWAFASSRNAGDGLVVPVAPAQCCKACIGTKAHSMEDCSALSNCHGHGICVVGGCDCAAGWGGADCSRLLQNSGWLPQWLLFTLMGLVLAISFGAMATTYSLVEDWNQQRRQAAVDAATILDPLLVATGSVGEVESDSEDDGMTQSVPILDSAQTSDVVGVRSSEMLSHGVDGVARSVSDTTSEQTELANRLVSSRETDDVETPLLKESGEKADDDEDEEKIDPELAAYLASKFDERKSPLHCVKCAICYDRPVQVVLVPCGHSNLCRRCARKLQECPFCRKHVVRRQRLYLAD